MLVLPWSTLKERPDRQRLYFSMLAVLLAGNGLHFAWLVTRDYNGDEMKVFAHGILFLLILVVSILVFNLFAILLRRAYRRKQQ